MRHLFSVLLLHICSLCILQSYAKGTHNDPSPAYKKVLMDDIQTLTFYRYHDTISRRGKVLPQLQCNGAPCARYQPDVVQCINRGDRQWKCEAALPATINFGAIQVSCEGWENVDDKYVVQGSCQLKYDLVNSAASGEGGWVSTLFLIIFWSFFIYIVLCCLYSCLAPRINPEYAGENGYDDAPPPYPGAPPKPSSQRPGAPVGFLSALGVGALAARLFGPGRQNRSLEPGMNYGTMPPYGRYGATGYYDQFQSDRYGSSTSNAGTANTSAGYGGTEIR